MWDTLKAHLEQNGILRSALIALGEAVIHGNKRDKKTSETVDGASRTIDKDVPHKNTARIKEFKGLYAELKKRIDRLSGVTRSGGIPKIAAVYGRGLEICAACHGRFGTDSYSFLNVSRTLAAKSRDSMRLIRRRASIPNGSNDAPR